LRLGKIILRHQFDARQTRGLNYRCVEGRVNGNRLRARLQALGHLDFFKQRRTQPQGAVAAVRAQKIAQRPDVFHPVFETALPVVLHTEGVGTGVEPVARAFHAVGNADHAERLSILKQLRKPPLRALQRSQTRQRVVRQRAGACERLRAAVFK